MEPLYFLNVFRWNSCWWALASSTQCNIPAVDWVLLSGEIDIGSAESISLLIYNIHSINRLALNMADKIIKSYYLSPHRQQQLFSFPLLLSVFIHPIWEMGSYLVFLYEDGNGDFSYRVIRNTSIQDAILLSSIWKWVSSRFWREDFSSFSCLCHRSNNWIILTIS